MLGGNKKKWIILAVVCCVVIAAAAMVIFNGKKNRAGEDEVPMPQTAEVERRTLVESVSATGKVTSSESKTVTALVTGVEIKTVDVEVGDTVAEGDLLCTLDTSTLEQNLADARASLSAAQEKAQISVSSAQRSLEEAQASRNIELERADQDVADAWNDYLKALTEQEEAESDYNEARDTTIEKNGELEHSEDLLEEAEKEMKDAAKSSGKSSEYESGFNRTLQNMEEYAQRNGLELRRNDIYMTADLSSLSAASVVEGSIPEGEDGEAVTAELEGYLGSLRGWQKKYREALAAESDYQSKKTEYEKLQQEVSSWQQKYNTAQQEEKTSENEFDNSMNTAESKLDAYNQKVRSKEDTVRNSESTVNSKNDSLQSSMQDAAISGMSDKQKIREYEKQIAACTVTAPISGIVTEVSVETGNSYGGGTIVVIEDNSGYEVTAEIDEYDISKIQVGQETVIKTNGTGDKELQGKVQEIAPRASTSGTGSGVTYKVDISVDTPCKELKMDMTAKMSIILNSAENVLTVPGDALQQEEDGSYYVEVLKNTEAEEIPSDGEAQDDGQAQMPQTEKIKVRKGMESDYYVEIISNDIEEGMKVIMPSTDEQDMQNMMQQWGPMGGF